jgi:hypothetical protein
MADLFAGAVPLSDQIAEAERELAMRERVYASWVEAGRLTRDRADLQTARMAAILKTLRGLEKSNGG